MTTQSISEPKAHKPKHFSFNLEKEIQSACAKIPPLWPLKNFVAVNPFLGLRDMRFHDACRLIHRVGHGDMILPVGHYQKSFQEIFSSDPQNPVAQTIVQCDQYLVDHPSIYRAPLLNTEEKFDSSMITDTFSIAMHIIHGDLSN